MNKFTETTCLLCLIALTLSFGNLEAQNADYIREDVVLNIEANHKAHKKIRSSRSLSVYTLLGRSNAYSVIFKNEMRDKLMAMYSPYLNQQSLSF